nr:zinc transporter 3-like [Pelodiscus sinensis]|eukprot:XP_014432529.1 zinc transporter 3-like [Pelodiscus sinensis]
MYRVGTGWPLWSECLVPLQVDGREVTGYWDTEAEVALAQPEVVAPDHMALRSLSLTCPWRPALHLTRHCHRGPPTPSQSRAELQACQKLGTACAICFVFMVGEVIGGYLAHSLAIMTDAAHLLADVGSMSVSLFSLWVSARPATKTMSFGWHRSETLGALASVLSIWVVTGVLVYLASARIISDNYEIDARAMLATSACAVGVNIMPWASWPGVIPTCPLQPRYKIADPISTFLFSIFVLGSTLTILRDVFRVLMEGELGWGHSGHATLREGSGRSS